MFELSYDEKHLISLVVSDTHTHRQTHTQTDLGVELTSPFGRGQLKIKQRNHLDQQKLNGFQPNLKNKSI